MNPFRRPGSHEPDDGDRPENPDEQLRAMADRREA